MWNVTVRAVVVACFLAAGCGPSTRNEGLSVTCGAGTTRKDDQCVAAPGSTLSCGAGTHESAGTCVADGSSVECGTGTTLDGGVCVGSVSCAAGTRLVNGKCQVDTGTVCGTDTTASGNTCVSSISCGPGTTRSGSTCVVNGSSACGAGTTWNGSQCVAGAANPDLASFSALASTSSSFFDKDLSTSSNNLHNYRFVATDLSQSTADGWTQLLSPLIGQGGAVHLRWFHNTDYPVDTTPRVIPIEDASGTANGCLTLTPGEMPSQDIDNAYVGFFGWNRTNATLVACAIGGTVTYVRETTTPQRVKLTFNVQFNDGTTWSDKVFYAPYHQG